MKIYVCDIEEKEFACEVTQKVFVCTQSDPITGITADSIIYTADDDYITADSI